MTTINLKQNESNPTYNQYQDERNCRRIWDVSGGPYKGCVVGGWITGDGDTDTCSDCSDNRFPVTCE